MVGLIRKGISAIVIESILIIAGVTLAVIFSSTVMSKFSEFQSRFAATTSEAIQGMSERLTYVYGTYSSSNGCFIVYIKNVGNYPVYSLERASVIFGSIGAATYVPYSDSANSGCGCWTYDEFSIHNGVLDPSEVVAIKIYNSSTIEPPYYLKFTTSKGTSVEAEFTLT